MPAAGSELIVRNLRTVEPVNNSYKLEGKMENKKSSNGIGFCSILTIVFIVLKLTGVISWKWVWVIAPTWIPLAIVIVCLVILGIVKYSES
jgi:uncharacterized protein (DUF983 family)